MAGSILGNRVLRKEDPKFLTDGGMYVDDLARRAAAGGRGPRHLRALVGRPRHDHRHRHVGRRWRCPASSPCYTAEDLEVQAGAGGVQPDGHPRPPGASTRSASSASRSPSSSPRPASQGEDAAEQVIVDYDALEALVDPEAAMTSTTLIYDGAGSNVVFDSTAVGMPGRHRRRVLRRLRGRRQGPVRQPARRPVPAGGPWRRAVVVGGRPRCTSGSARRVRRRARDAIKAGNGLGDEQVHVITPDVGGGFGAKITCYPEEILLGRHRQEGRPPAALAGDPHRSR